MGQGERSSATGRKEQGEGTGKYHLQAAICISQEIERIASIQAASFLHACLPSRCLVTIATRNIITTLSTLSHGVFLRFYAGYAWSRFTSRLGFASCMVAIGLEGWADRLHVKVFVVAEQVRVSRCLSVPHDLHVCDR